MLGPTALRRSGPETDQSRCSNSLGKQLPRAPWLAASSSPSIADMPGTAGIERAKANGESYRGRKPRPSGT